MLPKTRRPRRESWAGEVRLEREWLGAPVLGPTDGATRTPTTGEEEILGVIRGAMIWAAKHGGTGYAEDGKASIQIGVVALRENWGALVGFGEWDL